MIEAVCFVPCAPALVPEVGRGLDLELGPVRSATAAAIAAVDGTGRAVVLVGPGPALPLGRYFAPHSAAEYPIGADAETPQLPDGPAGLVVLGDGSARRTEKAPGYLDARAAGYDDAVTDALASGDPARLAALDRRLGDELLAAGAPVWQAVAPLLTRRYAAEVTYAGDPFGVGYVVAVWR